MRPVLLFLALLLLPGTLQARQGPDLRIEAGGKTESFATAKHRGYRAYPATALRTLGASLVTEPRGLTVILFGDTIAFEAHSPFFRASGRVHQLVGAAYGAGDRFLLPGQFFTEWLPARYPEHIRLEGGVLRSTRPVETAAATGAKPRTETAKPPEATRVVIIDAGHGGRDPGKIGPNGLKEKDVTLAVARRLAAILREKQGYEVHLTRTADTLIALADRPRLANQWKANRPAAVFISLHANAGPAKAVGFETFFLSEARTEDERRVAEMENAAVEYEEDRGNASEGDDLGWILNHLRNDFYLRASNDLAEVIQKRTATFHPGPNRGVKQAGFRVLVGAFMPAVLVEMAFISNPKEASLLGTADFQKKIAAGLADAVDQFFASHEHLWLADGSH